MARREGGVTAVALALLVLVSIPNATILAADPVDPVDSSAQAQAYADTFGVSLAVAQTRIDRQPAIGELNAYLGETYPGEFAGLWIDHEPRYRIVVAATDFSLISGDLDKSALAPFIERQAARYPLGELLEIQSALRNTMPDEAAMVGLDVRSNRVLVESIESLNSGLAEERAGVPADVVVYRTIEAMPTIQTTLHGAGRLGGNGCTSGFSVKKTINGQVWKGITTASHCTNAATWQPTGEDLFFRGGAIGGGAGHDEQWHTLPGQPNAAVNQVYDGQGGGSTPYFQPITGWLSKANQNVGDWVCKWGRVTLYDCGQIADLNADGCAPLGDQAIRVHQPGVDLGEPGDSGYPWFSNSSARATHSCGINGPGGDSWAVAINVVLTGLGVSLVTN